MDKQPAGLRELLAFNLKKNRRVLGLSQAKLAEKANTSTQYVAMIELSRKFPTPEMLERLAAALEVEAPELFSMPPSYAGALKKLREEVLADMAPTINAAVEQAVQGVITSHINNLAAEL
ncbi:MAG: helix-turn-helix transcriptional regulator [Treponematales bacterium]